MSELERVKEQLRTLQGWYEKYAFHTQDCAYYQDVWASCTCGYFDTQWTNGPAFRHYAEAPPLSPQAHSHIQRQLEAQTGEGVS